MLIEFSFENYLSFKDKATLSFLIPGTKDKYPGRYMLEVEQGRYSLSPFAALYGKNASGKSNVIKALKDFVRLILSSHKLDLDAPIPAYKPYKLDVNSRTAPVSFDAEFVVEGVRYSFHLRIDRLSILEEKLDFFPRGRRTLLYSRVKGNAIKFGNSFKGAPRSIEQHLRDNVLFLSMAVSMNNELLKPIYRYFQTQYEFHVAMDSREHIVIETTLKLLKEQGKSTPYKNVILGFLNAADISVSDIIIQKNEELAKRLPFPIEMPQQEKDEIIETLANRPLLGHKVYDVQKDTGETVFLDLGGEESGGTIKMYELAGEVVDALQEGGMLFIDEFNSGLHPQLCEYIIGLFRKKSTNPHGAQLVVVNHDTNLMAQDDIYRDEIWLVDRNEYGESELYSIDEFSKNEVRKGTNLEKWYLDGRFKAIPSIFPSEFKLEISK
jgi:AAA15 family ATPase/GTPase